jgi:hypothetical protein
MSVRIGSQLQLTGTYECTILILKAIFLWVLRQSSCGGHAKNMLIEVKMSHSYNITKKTGFGGDTGQGYKELTPTVRLYIFPFLRRYLDILWIPRVQNMLYRVREM